MNKIFAKTFFALQAKPSKRICKNWDPSLFLLYDVKLHGKKEKTDDPETCIPGNGKMNETKLIGHSCWGGCSTCFSLQRGYRFSVTVWWFFLGSLWMKLFVSQGLIQAFFGLFDGHKWFTASIEKHQLGAKATKMGTPPHIIAV